MGTGQRASSVARVGHFHCPAVWAACFVATILEASPLPINDNVAAPLGAALVLVGMMSIWPN